jgi:DNA invertase Pin-like site-specific DNA recombinase
MSSKRKVEKAFGYMRTSSATNVGEGKDSEARQRKAIESYAKAAGYEITGWYYDASVKGADPVHERPGFASMLAAIAGNGVRTIICESPDRFARDLVVQLTGHDHLKALGVTLIPASAPSHFVEETPTAIMVRQILGAVAQFEKATMVAKLKGARDRKRKEKGGKVEGRKSYAERENGKELVELARKIHRPDPARRPISLRKVSAALAAHGYVTPSGKPYSASAVASMVR